MKLETDADQLKEELASADKLPFKVTNGQENMRGCYNFDCKDRMWLRFTPAPPADASGGQQE